MSAFKVIKRTGKVYDRALLLNCANGCRSRGSWMLAGAESMAVFLDRHRVPLCRRCAREWRAAWDGALPAAEEVAA